MAKVFPSEFNFIPRTWILPSEYTALQTYSLESKKRRKKVKAFIVKPANGAMGNGLVGFLYSFLIPFAVVRMAEGDINAFDAKVVVNRRSVFQLRARRKYKTAFYICYLAVIDHISVKIWNLANQMTALAHVL